MVVDLVTVETYEVWYNRHSNGDLAILKCRGQGDDGETRVSMRFYPDPYYKKDRVGEVTLPSADRQKQYEVFCHIDRFDAFRELFESETPVKFIAGYPSGGRKTTRELGSWYLTTEAEPVGEEEMTESDLLSNDFADGDVPDMLRDPAE